MRPGLLLRPGLALLWVLLLLGLVIRIVDSSTKRHVSDVLLKTVYSPFFAIRNWSAEQVALREENARLRHLLAGAAWSARQGEQAMRDVERLRVLLDQPPPVDRQVYIARVIGWDRRGGRDEVIVDRGESGGLSLYAPAITERGVAGRVSFVLDDHARVQLLTDPAFRVAVRDARTGVLGVVRVGRGGELYMDHVAVESDIVAGDMLITAGIGGVFPEGLRVGQVTHVERSGSLLLQVELTAAADLARLDYLFFLESETPLPPGAPYDVEGGRPGS